jgi:S-adenosylmethionine-diacylglycerol 3-amino-3-carboxypropyl transferase
MYLCGVHPRQLATVADRHGIYEFVRERIEYALTRVPIYDNYFLSATVTGKFRGERVPPYLLRENFDTLKRNIGRVTVVNGWLGPYLDSLPAESIDKFNLLDIFDWMDAATFEKTLQSVLRAARAGARMIYRSGNYENPPPGSVLPHLRPHAELARRLLATDRSATYGSFYVFSIAKRDPGEPVSDRSRVAISCA